MDNSSSNKVLDINLIPDFYKFFNPLEERSSLIRSAFFNKLLKNPSDWAYFSESGNLFHID